MSNLQNVSDELKILQREVAELRAQRKERRSEAESAVGETSKVMDAHEETEPSQDSSGESQYPEWGNTIQDIATHLERVAKEIDETTRERPMLGLMAAFTSGIVVGYLLSRRN